MPKLAKPLHIKQEVYAAILRPTILKSSAYELANAPVGFVPLGQPNEYIADLLYVNKDTQRTKIKSGSNDYGVEVGSYNAVYPGGLPAMIMVEAEASGTGWSVTFHMAASEYNHHSLKEGRMIGVTYCESLDNDVFRQGQLFRVVILEVHHDFGLFGEQTVQLVGYTIDKIFDGFNLIALPYLLQSVVGVNAAGGGGELGWWNDHDRTALDLEHELYDEGMENEPFVGTIFDGFAQPFDKLDLFEGRFTSLPPANTKHFLTALSPLHALRELLENHVAVNSGNGYQSLTKRFPLTIEDGADGLTDLMHYTLNAGSVNGIISEQTKHGWLYWCDGLSRINIVQDDWMRPNGGGRTPALHITDTRSLFGTFSVTPAQEYGKAGRVVVERLYSASEAGGGGTGSGGLASSTNMNPLQTHYAIPSNGAVYPRTALRNIQGNEIEFTQIATKSAAKFAASRYNQNRYTQQATITDFPFVGFAAALFNRIVRISAKDPKGGFDFSGSKSVDFRITGVSIKLNGIDKVASGGGYYTADLALTQVANLPPGV